MLTLLIVQGALSIYRNTFYSWSLISAIGVIAVISGLSGWLIWRNRTSPTTDSQATDMVQANPTWGTFQQSVWDETSAVITDLLKKDSRLDAIPHHSMSVLRKISASWNKTQTHSEYAATVPEALLAAEVLATRYRKVLIENVPFSGDIKVSTVLQAWDIYQSHGTKLQNAYKAYRVYSAFSIPGVLKELASALLGPLSDQALENLIYNLKRAYLLEVASVAIDLYSGMFKRANDELDFAQDIQKDRDIAAREVGPIRIMVIGQTSSGKSSLINAILDQFKAESGLTPTTETDSAYEFSLSDGFDTYIIDTPGIDRGAKSVDETVSKIANADLLIWVMRSNQPGRSIDSDVNIELNDYFGNNTNQQRPIVIVAATHIDCIPAFTSASENTLMQVTRPLAEACSKVVDFDEFCPLSLVEPCLGVSELRNVIANSYEKALNTRLNRIRTLKPESPPVC
ncbi:GTPase [Congregibacter litoralis]|nr:GTPase domain-containing protein [Congregibacter litoralis]